MTRKKITGRTHQVVAYEPLGHGSMSALPGVDLLHLCYYPHCSIVTTSRFLRFSLELINKWRWYLSNILMTNKTQSGTSKKTY